MLQRFCEWYLGVQEDQLKMELEALRRETILSTADSVADYMLQTYEQSMDENEGKNGTVYISHSERREIREKLHTAAQEAAQQQYDEFFDKVENNLEDDDE